MINLQTSELVRHRIVDEWFGRFGNSLVVQKVVLIPTRTRCRLRCAKPRLTAAGEQAIELSSADATSANSIVSQLASVSFVQAFLYWQSEAGTTSHFRQFSVTITPDLCFTGRSNHIAES